MAGKKIENLNTGVYLPTPDLPAMPQSTYWGSLLPQPIPPTNNTYEDYYKILQKPYPQDSWGIPVDTSPGVPDVSGYLPQESSPPAPEPSWWSRFFDNSKIGATASLSQMFPEKIVAPTQITDADVKANEAAAQARLIKEAELKNQYAPTVDPYAASQGKKAPEWAFGSARADLEKHLNDPEYKREMALYNQRAAEALDAQKQGIAGQQMQMRLANDMPVQLDLSPLMALADQWTGSSLTRAYKRPTSAEERQAAIMQLEQGLQKSMGALSEDEKNLLRTKMEDKWKVMHEKMAADEIDMKRMQQKQDKEAMDQYKFEKMKNERLDHFEKNYGKELEGLASLRSSLQNLTDLIDQKGGVITETDPTYQAYMANLSNALTRYNVDFAKLGALAGGDLNLLKDRINKGGFAEMLKELISGADPKHSLTQIKNDIDTHVENLKTPTKSYQKYIPEEYAARFGAYNAAKAGSLPSMQEISPQTLNSTKNWLEKVGGNLGAH